MASDPAPATVPPAPVPVPAPIPAPAAAAAATTTTAATTRGRASRPTCRYCGRRGHRSEVCRHQPNTMTVLAGGSARYPPGTTILVSPGAPASDPVVLIQGSPKKNKKKGTGGGGCQERDLGRGPEPGGGGGNGAPPTGAPMEGVRA
ncbi:hypothetical protein EDB80DRAFT_867243 [Ilyonectria destructans]|nr:hypothetical protein EDB80DRAFT_867243 [Ilyonectria destructans]